VNLSTIAPLLFISFRKAICCHGDTIVFATDIPDAATAGMPKPAVVKTVHTATTCAAIHEKKSVVSMQHVQFVTKTSVYTQQYEHCSSIKQSSN
jgi:hypothetical protein